jgi:hypothetical protein
MKALIDADIIVYSAGSAADHRYYVVDEKEFSYKSEAQEYVQQTYGITEDKYESKKDWRAAMEPFITFVVDSAPVQYSLSNCKGLITSIMESTGAKTATLYLTSDDQSNYRFERATIKPYKGNRSNSVKPTRYEEMRKYLVNQWGAIMVHGKEADDAMGIAQCQAEDNTTIICSCDKDLLMIPGWHYNWQKDGAQQVSIEQGWRNFYYQLLIGDATDNIPGVPGVGAKNKLAVSIRDGGFEFDREIIEMAILTEYIRKYEYKAWEAMRENADLLWIQQQEDVLWEPVIEAPVSEGQGQEATAVGDEATDSEVQVA